MAGTGSELFDDLPIPDARPAPSLKAAAARVRRPNRNQIELRPSDLESLLSEDHPALILPSTRGHGFKHSSGARRIPG